MIKFCETGAFWKQKVWICWAVRLLVLNGPIDLNFLLENNLSQKRGVITKPMARTHLRMSFLVYLYMLSWFRKWKLRGKSPAQRYIRMSAVSAGRGSWSCDAAKWDIHSIRPAANWNLKIMVSSNWSIFHVNHYVVVWCIDRPTMYKNTNMSTSF